MKRPLAAALVIAVAKHTFRPAAAFWQRTLQPNSGTPSTWAHQGLRSSRFRTTNDAAALQTCSLSASTGNEGDAVKSSQIDWEKQWTPDLPYEPNGVPSRFASLVCQPPL